MVEGLAMARFHNWGETVVLAAPEFKGAFLEKSCWPLRWANRDRGGGSAAAGSFRSGRAQLGREKEALAQAA